MSRTVTRLGVLGACILAASVHRASSTSYRFAPIGDARARLAATVDVGPGNRFRGRGGRGFGGNAPDAKILDTFDVDGNGRLDAQERVPAREHAESLELNRGRGGRGFGGATPVAAGRPFAPAAARPYPTTPFYDEGTLRTLFLTFENDDWERELMAFKRTDVDVMAALAIDGKRYEDVGVQFHGNSSFSGVPIGLKHSMRIALDAVHDKQDVSSYNTLLLLNAHDDPSFIRTVLTLRIAREYFPAPKANFVRVVINGESWGIYASQQQFNKDLTNEFFKSKEGARWKVPGSPGFGQGGLSYLGEDVAPYRTAYDIKSKDEPASWAALVKLTRVLNETPPGELEFALAPLLDIDGALRFLAVDNALVNSDGYWTRASDYSLYMEPNGRFHVLPYDVNTTFVASERRGGFGRGGSIDLHPLQAAEDFSKPLASRLLAVPELRRRYLRYVRDVASKWLDWRRLGPLVTEYHALIGNDARSDTKKLASYEDFVASVETLRSFAERRRSFLLEVTATIE
jgi:hypothetical protein